MITAQKTNCLTFAEHASHLYFSATFFKTHFSLDPKERMLEELIMRRLTKAADEMMELSVQLYNQMLKQEEFDRKKKEEGQNQVTLITSEEIERAKK